MGGIRDSNISESANISVGKLAFPYILNGKHTDGTLPKVVWVAKGGADSDSSRQGGRDEPYLTLSGASGAFRNLVDGRGDRVILGPGTWRENLDLGSGTGTTGAAGRMNKRDVGLYGSGGAHPGRCQIVGDGTATGPTIRVRTGYGRGFILADVEVGSVTAADVDRALPLLDLETSNVGALTATSSDQYLVLRNVKIDGGATATGGLILTGTQMLRAYNLEVAGCVVGIVLRGSTSNFPDNLQFVDTVYHDNVTADVATVGGIEGQWTFTVAADVDLANIRWQRSQYMDRGGTPVTNYVNAISTNCVNVIDLDFWAARDVADGTLMQLPANWIAIGHSAGGVESIIGA